MTTYATAADLRAALVKQLYDDWHGYYLLRQLICEAWCDVRPLSRDEALRYRLREDEALELIWNKEISNG